MKYEFFLDIDDTLASFTMRTLKFMGVPVGDFEYDKYPTDTGYDLVSAFNKLSGKDFNLKEFWNAVPRRLWSNLPKSEEFDIIINEAERIAGRENVYIATAPTKDPECLAGKLDWMVDNLPEWLHRQYFVTPRKYILGAPGRILIDDSDRNCDMFRRLGGQAILVPRPWNTLKDFDARTYVSGALGLYPSAPVDNPST